MKRYIAIALAAGVAVSACKDNSTAAPTDAPTVDAIKNLTKTTLQQLAIGVISCGASVCSGMPMESRCAITS